MSFVKEFIKHLFPRFILKENLKITYTFCLGGLAFSAFIVLVVSGVLLMFYYVPHPEHAYNSILYLEENVFLGKYIRNLHRLSSHALLILIFLHTVRVVLTGAFKVRSYNWIVGLLLMFLSIVAGYTGYLLPMDQLAYWATQTGMEILKLVPLGDEIVNLIAPDGVGGFMTLSRFYTLHIVIVPMSIFLLSMIHFYRIRKDKGVLPYL